MPVPPTAGSLAERLAAITHDLLGAAGADRRLIWTNPAWQPLLGWTAEELAARSYHELIHPEDLPRVQDAERRRARAAAPATRPETELRLRARDGSYRWFVFSTNYAPADALVYFSGKDITARKHGEEELRAADERFRAVTGSTRDAIVSADGTAASLLERAAPRRCSAAPAERGARPPAEVLMPERYRDAHRAGMARYPATGEARVIGPTVELEGLRADGTSSRSSSRSAPGAAAARSASPPSSATSPTACAPAARCARPRSASPGRSRAPRWASRSPPPTARCCAPTARCASCRRPEAELRGRALRRARCTPTTAAPTPPRSRAMLGGPHATARGRAPLHAADGDDRASCASTCR